jgi:REP element-mobilizing transposase RayT
MPNSQLRLKLADQSKQHGGSCEFCEARESGRKLRRPNPCAQRHQGRRKAARPHSARTPLHVTFRSSKARGGLSFLHPAHAQRIKARTQAAAKRFQVRVHQFANVGNHLHLLIEGRTRDGIKHFLRTMGAQVATVVTGARKGRPFGKFWDDLVFSRVVARGRDFLNTRWYILLNFLAAAGIVNHHGNGGQRRMKNQRTRADSDPKRTTRRPPPFPREWEGFPE